jgi:hypothetical protein
VVHAHSIVFCVPKEMCEGWPRFHTRLSFFNSIPILKMTKYSPVQVFSAALEIKNIANGIKKGIINKYSRMIVANSIQRCGIEREHVGQEVNISLHAKILCGVLAGTRSTQGSCIIQTSGAELKETTLPNRESY